MAIEIHWIRDDLSLGEHCRDWRQLPFVAVDTEFMRVDTFYPKAGLIQIGDGKCAFLIDPLLIGNWQPLAELIEDRNVVKVLHACSEDLEVLLRLTGKLPQPLFDTQLAAGYLNLGFSMGYSRLVQEVLGIDLPKGETRSDWLQRPLSETQVSYAAEDAVHLAELFSALRARLSDDKYAWVLEDGAELVAQLRREVQPDSLYREVKLAWKLSPQQLAVLRALCAWREREARLRDVPRNRILKEHALWPIAKSQPTNLAALARIDDMHPRTLRQDGETLLQLIKHAASLPAEQWPEPLPEPLPFGLTDGPYTLPDSLRGWRRERMGQALLDSLAGAGDPQ